MKSLEESVVAALDGSDIELYPFLPYILQDIWEIGTDPDVVIALIAKYFSNYNDLEILDLGCGKGAVSVKLAQRFHCSCRGIDAMSDFIQTAKEKAKEFGYESYCTFEVGDIRKSLTHLPEFDVIILGAIGPVLGDYKETLTTLSKHLKAGGVFIIDDAYIENSSDFTSPHMLKYDELIMQIESAGICLVENRVVSNQEVIESDDLILSSIKQRCRELAEKHPEKKHIFEDYIAVQEFESDVNANKAVCTTLVIKKNLDR
ncbi:MAG: class I SAM-dependent methyltransferase [Bacteroidales bacterium]|nr:class I SAM-dependent methyltransferase [Bacteroidales bacterium]